MSTEPSPRHPSWLVILLLLGWAAVVYAAYAASYLG
jgi:hypothetical protein